MARFLGLILSTAATAKALGSGWPTSGTQSGQVRVYSWTGAQEVGCLTKDGGWNASGNCDTFTAQALGTVYEDIYWTQLEIRNSAGNKCWFPDAGTLKLVCDGSIADTLWLHTTDYKADILVHSRALDSYVPLDGAAPSGGNSVALQSHGQTQDGNNYQLIWAKA
ncbi:proteasome core particle subunit beta 2 [Hypoxylon texense]